MPLFFCLLTSLVSLLSFFKGCQQGISKGWIEMLVGYLADCTVATKFSYSKHIFTFNYELCFRKLHRDLHREWREGSFFQKEEERRGIKYLLVLDN